MKTIQIKTVLRSLLIFILAFSYSTISLAQNKKKKLVELVDTIDINFQQSKPAIELKFIKGESHNHPTFAIWLESLDGTYLETIFVTEYISSGIFGNADAGDGSWKSKKGEAIRPAALPYWSHKRNIISRDSLYIPTPENPVTDAISGATPAGSFILKTSTSVVSAAEFNILLEINQTWDWNDYWTNNKFPGNKDYKTSSQPSIIYKGEIDLSRSENEIILKPIGRGHYAGNDGDLYKDLSTFTTALDIADSITVTITK